MELASDRRRFGPFPGGTPEGIRTAEASRKDGYETGLSWKDAYVPSGPWVHRWSNVGGGSVVAAHPEEYRAYCDATVENHREWMAGWREGVEARRAAGLPVTVKL